MDKNTPNNKSLTASQREELLATLRERFEKNMNRHPVVEWADVLVMKRLEKRLKYRKV